MTKASKAPSRISHWCLLAAGLALASGLWAAFLWQQLVVARSGGEPFCALGGGGCAALWDGAFASAVHESSGLPVAAWGIVWSGAALVTALLAWNQSRSERSPEPWWSGAALLAGAGLASVVLLLGASLAAGEFCSNCAVTYLLVAGYAGVVFVGSAVLRPVAWGNGAATAAAVMVGFFLVLLSPGLDTPKAGAQLGGSALAGRAPGAADASAELVQFIGGLAERERQNLALARQRHVLATRVAARPVRALVGNPAAPMRLTTFTDSGCSHCAHFHEALEAMRAQLPPGALAVEQRMFPLDGSCNTHVQGRGRPELCLAARLRVCLEKHPRALELTGWLHGEAAPLSTESIYRVATRLAPRAELEACVASAETQATIVEDNNMAVEAGLRGTPFLLVNGKPTLTYLPFLYAMALAGADADHPAFAALPTPPPPTADQDAHAGHGHP